MDCPRVHVRSVSADLKPAGSGDEIDVNANKSQNERFAHAQQSFIVLKRNYTSKSKQDKKMSEMDKSYSFHSVIVSAKNIAITKCFMFYK